MTKNLPTHQVGGLYRRNVGTFRVATVHDGMLDTAFEDVVGIAPATWESAHKAAFRGLPPRLSCNTFVLQTAQALIFVDTGCGQTASDAGLQARNLDLLGVTPNDIDIVLMTHLHRDHAAGLINAAGQALFPRAEVVLHREELAFWRDSNTLTRLRDSQKLDFSIAASVLSAYAERLRPIGPGEVVPGITAIATPGHTPGHTAWLLDSQSERLLIWGDVVHLPVIQFAIPEASVVYDIDSQAAAASRQAVLAMAAAERLPVAGVHLDFPCFGRVEEKPGGGFTYTTEVWESVL